MRDNIKDSLIVIIKDALNNFEAGSGQEGRDLDLCLDLPAENRFGDLTTNIALRLSKSFGKSPYECASALLVNIKKYLEKAAIKKYVKEVKVEGGGFINFYLSDSYFHEQLKQLLVKGKEYLRENYGMRKKVLIEFVSANPTGPLSIAHARQAVVGDVLANILAFLGFAVKREYYLNDEGNQINILGKSVELRLKELMGEEIGFPQDYYQGDYIYEIAREIKKSLPAGRQEKSKSKNFQEFALKYILDIIKKELGDFGVKFDYWYSQKKLRESGKIETVLEALKRNGFIYEQDGALWFKSTQFGDDKDRVVVKSDATHTYLAPDIAYHQEKYRRGFIWLINLWGPDHHGYISRLKAAIQALGYVPESLSVIIVQLASIFEKGRPMQMSTRKGQYITLREVLSEVGSDAMRFFFLMRRTSSLLDFDLQLAKEQTPENPIYYVQYAHARICSILYKSKLRAKFRAADLSLLKEKEELELIKKLLQFPYLLNICYKTVDPYMLTVYLQETAEAFHRFYDRHRVLDQNQELSKARVALIKAAKIVVATGLELMGISRPEKM